MAATGMPSWAEAEFSGPQWADYQQQIQQLQARDYPGNHFPRPWDLQNLLPDEAATRSGFPIRFVPSEQIPGVAYEEHIYRSGQVSTRPDNWHDLFNALVWSKFPHIKAAMNAAHFEQLRNQRGAGRGKRRDALTLFDECGAVVVSRSETLLQALAGHEWTRAFLKMASDWDQDSRVFICGHAMLEKFLNPYKAMTAHILLVKIEGTEPGVSRSKMMQGIDEFLATKIADKRCLQSSRELSPLPLAGIPGWWQASVQDELFYSDRQVFRPLRTGVRRANILEWEKF